MLHDYSRVLVNTRRQGWRDGDPVPSQLPVTKSMRAPDTDSTDQTSTAERNSDELTRDTLFSLLGNQQRRLAIRYLKQTVGCTSLGDLAEQVAAWEADVSREAITCAQRKRACTSLQQRHLPTLDEAGVVDFDANRGTVEVTDKMRKLDVYLEVVPERDIPWCKYYLGLGLASCALVVGIAVTESPFESVSGLGWAAVIGATFTASAAVHTYRSHTLRAYEPVEVRQR